MLVMNPSDGEILAMVGSADYNNAAIRGQINLTGVDPLGWRGVGSSFKVYTYAAALQAGLVTPATLLNDEAGGVGGPQRPHPRAAPGRAVVALGLRPAAPPSAP